MKSRAWRPAVSYDNADYPIGHTAEGEEEEIIEDLTVVEIREGWNKEPVFRGIRL